MSPTSDWVSVARSVNASNGETDLEFNLLHCEKRIKVLVENKVDATLQPRQGQRYGSRAMASVSAGDCDRATTALIAPASYASTEPFDHRIDYESILAFFEDAASTDDRSRCKAVVLRQAIERAHAGWTLVPNKQATDFWEQYWHLAHEVAPELAMPPPGAKPGSSGFVHFKPVSLRRGVALIHKLPYGNVDLQFAGEAKDAEGFHARYGHVLDPGMLIAKASKSLVVRLRVGRIQLERPFADAREEVLRAIDHARRLLNWYQVHIAKVGAT